MDIPCRVCTLIYFEFAGIKVLVFKLKRVYPRHTNASNILQEEALKSAILILACIS
jgi:hypothetical protein